MNDMYVMANQSNMVHYVFIAHMFKCCLFTLLFWSFIFLKMVKIILLNTHSHFNTFKMVKIATVNCHSTTVKSHFKIFFYLTKHYFNIKSNNFKCLHPNTHSHSNTFKIVNSFCLFQIRINKMAKITVNNGP